MMYFTLNQDIAIQNTDRIVTILSIAVVTLFILLILNMYKVYKLKEKLKACEKK
jgi:hypothetical protein